MQHTVSVRYEHGVFVPEERVDLPENTRLTVVLPPGGAARGRYLFGDLCGRLAWSGDPVKAQRALRDEW